MKEAVLPTTMFKVPFGAPFILRASSTTLRQRNMVDIGNVKGGFNTIVLPPSKANAPVSELLDAALRGGETQTTPSGFRSRRFTSDFPLRLFLATSVL